MEALSKYLWDVEENIVQNVGQWPRNPNAECGQSPRRDTSSQGL